MMTTKVSRKEIQAIYRNVLFREADNSGLHSYQNSGLSASEIAQRLRQSDEYRTRVLPIVQALQSDSEKKILLFGAYGNGNLGDAIQPAYIEKGLRNSGFEGQIWATSFLSRHFHYNADRKLPHFSIQSNEILKYFDLIIVGGGGLLSHPHHPLNDPLWAEQLETPTALLAIGATNKSVSESASLIKKAIFVSARDSASYNCLKQFRDDVYFVRDPVLCLQDYAPISATTAGQRTAWILRGPLSEAHNHIRRLINEQDVIIGFEPQVDKEIEGTFPEIIYTPTVESFLNQLKWTNRVFSMRYHGLILALPFVSSLCGYGDPKNRELLSDLGRPHAFANNPHEIFKPGIEIQQDEIRMTRETTTSWKEQFMRNLAHILRLIL